MDMLLFTMSPTIVVAGLTATAVFFAFMVWYWIIDRKVKLVDRFNLVSQVGVVSKLATSSSNSYHLVLVRGELWKATSVDQLNLNDKVRVVSVSNSEMVLEVTKEI